MTTNQKALDFNVPPAISSAEPGPSIPNSTLERGDHAPVSRGEPADRDLSASVPVGKGYPTDRKLTPITKIRFQFLFLLAGEIPLMGNQHRIRETAFLFPG